jgi:orotidine-5'-phosphate decarboxylase
MHTQGAGFGARLAARVAQTAPAVVGIDPHLDRIPDLPTDRPAQAAAVAAFSARVIEAVADVVAAVKPQVAFYEQLGAPGVAALEETCRRAREAGLLVLLDAKRGDIGSTARAYVRATLADDGPIGADAVTLSPYLGPESLEPFVDYAKAHDKGLFVLLRTSNPGAGPWQRDTAIAEHVASWVRAVNQDGKGTVGVVVGATLPQEAPHWRAAIGDACMLVPGFGAQGATADDVRGHFLPDGSGALVTSSRAVLFPASGYDAADSITASIRDRAKALVDALDR